MTSGESGGTKPQELTLSEISEKYKDRWVATEVTSRGKDFQPLKGRVVENDVDRFSIGRKLPSTLTSASSMLVNRHSTYFCSCARSSHRAGVRKVPSSSRS